MNESFPTRMVGREKIFTAKRSRSLDRGYLYIVNHKAEIASCWVKESKWHNLQVAAIREKSRRAKMRLGKLKIYSLTGHLSYGRDGA